MRRVRIFDRLLRVRDEPEPAPSGSQASVPPLLCVHGAGMSSVVFMDLLRRMTPGRRVIAPDLPGHGQSQRRDGAANLDGYRDTLRALCDALSLPRVVVIGHSLGAGLALSLAMADPGRVAGLVLLNGAAKLSVPDEVFGLVQASLPERDSAAIEGTRADFIDRMPDAFADLLFSPATSPELRARWQAMLWSADAATLIDDFVACRHIDLRDTLRVLQKTWRVPTLCIAGRDDLLVPPSLVAETADLLPGAELHVLEDSGHLSHIEQAAAFFPMLDAFVREKRS